MRATSSGCLHRAIATTDNQNECFLRSQVFPIVIAFNCELGYLSIAPFLQSIGSRKRIENRCYRLKNFLTFPMIPLFVFVILESIDCLLFLSSLSPLAWT